MLAYPRGQLSPARALQAALSAGCACTAAPMHLRSIEFVTERSILAFFPDSATVCLLFLKESYWSPKKIGSTEQKRFNEIDTMQTFRKHRRTDVFKWKVFNPKFIVLWPLFIDVWLTSGTEHNHKSKFWKSGKQQEYSTIHFVLHNMKSRKPGLFCSPMFFIEKMNWILWFQ